MPKAVANHHVVCIDPSMLVHLCHIRRRIFYSLQADGSSEAMYPPVSAHRDALIAQVLGTRLKESTRERCFAGARGTHHHYRGITDANCSRVQHDTACGLRDATSQHVQF
jgi:hypothetical protein